MLTTTNYILTTTKYKLTTHNYMLATTDSGLALMYLTTKARGHEETLS